MRGLFLRQKKQAFCAPAVRYSSCSNYPPTIMPTTAK